MVKLFTRLFLPLPVRAAHTACTAVPFLFRGARCALRGKLAVDVLDAAAIGISMLRRDFGTASSVTFLLGIGEILEEWTHKKSVSDLAGRMSLNIEKVWQWEDGTETLVPDL